MKKSTSSSNTHRIHSNTTSPRHIKRQNYDQEIKQSPTGTGKVPWKRILYEKQHYKDNHYDPKTFFNQLRIVRPFENLLSPESSFSTRIRLWMSYYFQLVFHCTMIVQQFSATSFFLCLHKYLLNHYIRFKEVAFIDFTFLLIGIGCYYLFELPNRKQRFSLLGFVRTIVLFIMTLKMTSPIIKTLTFSISEDTIQALTIFLAVIHLVFHDYQELRYENGTLSSANRKKDNNSVNPSIISNTKPILNKPAILSPEGNTLAASSSYLPTDLTDEDKHLSSRVLSLNTAIFTAILLASRLDDNNTVVAYIVLALISFVLFPIMIALIKKRSSIIFLCFAIIQWFGTSYLILRLDWTLFIAYELLVLLLWFFGPFLFLLLLPYKKAYKGPWDTAKIT